MSEDFVEVKIVVPKRDNSGNLINPEVFNKYIKDIVNVVGYSEEGKSPFFESGISFMPDIYGCYVWRDTPESKPRIKCEDNFEIMALAPKDAVDKIENVAKEMAGDLGQASILMEVFDIMNDDNLFVSGEYKESLEGTRKIFNPIFQPDHISIKGEGGGPESTL